MHGLGNDYLFVDAIQGSEQDVPPPEVVRRASDRHRGIGSDGVIAILPPEAPGAAFRMRIWNADGSEGEMCGNGLRCAVKLAYERGYVPRDQPSCKVQTGAGLLETLPMWDEDRVVACREELGVPSLDLPDRPGVQWIDREVEWRRADDDLLRRHRATAVSMGNPHLVLFREPDDALPLDVYRDGPVLEHHPLFPRRVNVGFAEVLDAHEVRLAVWERGSGATLACGTGAAACLVAGVVTGRLRGNVRIHLPGGVLEASWEGSGHPVWLSGPAEMVGPCVFDPR